MSTDLSFRPSLGLCKAFCMAFFVSCCALSPELLPAAILPAPLAPTTSDLWDVSQGASITHGSQTEFYSRTRNALGGDSADLLQGHAEHLNIIFKDFLPKGTVHFMEWQTPQPITLRSFALFAGHDGAPNTTLDRAISKFRLFAFNGATNAFDQLLYDFNPSNPYALTPTPPGAILEFTGRRFGLAANVEETMAQRFRAEFTQLSSRLAPRIIELDGFSTPIPEPSSLVLVGVFAGFCGWLRVSTRAVELSAQDDAFKPDECKTQKERSNAE